MDPNWEALAQQDAQNSLKVQSVRGSITRGMDYNPDDYAKALKLAARTGVAPDLAQEFHPEVQKAADLGQIDFFNLIAHNPAASKWLASQDNAAIAHDDLGTLTKIENDLRAPKYASLTHDQRESVVQDALRVAQHNQGTGSINHAFLSPLVDFGKKVALYSPTGMLESQLTSSASGGFKQASNLWDWMTGKQTLAQTNMRGAQINQDYSPVQALTRPGWVTQQVQRGAGSDEVGPLLGSINHAFLSPLVDFGKKVAPYTPTGMLESQLTSSASGGFKQASNLWDWMTGKQTLAQTNMRGAQINQDYSPVHALTRPGWVTQQVQRGADYLVGSAMDAQKVGPQAVLTDKSGKAFHNPMADTFSGDWGAMDWARQEVVNPLLTRNTLNALGGIPGTIGATMVGGEMTPFIFATNAAQAKMEQAKAEGANPTVAYLEGLGSGLLNFLLMTKMPAPVETKTSTGAITQGLGRAVALGAPMTAGENLLARMHDPNRPLTQGMAEGIATFAGFELPGAIGHAVNAYQTQKMLQGFKDAAEASKLRQRSPEAFHDYVEQATKGTSTEHLMVPAEAFMTYFQSQGMDPARIAEELGAKNFQEAAVAGTDVVIPTANWVSKIVMTPHGEALAPDVRLRPGDLTAREIQNLQEHAPEILATMKAQGEMDAKAEEQPAFQSIKEDTFHQLVAAGDTPNVAETRAFNHAKVMTTLAERAGIDPMDLHDRYGLKIVRDMGEGPSHKDALWQTSDIAKNGGERNLENGAGHDREAIQADLPREGSREVSKGSGRALGGETRPAWDPATRTWSNLDRLGDRPSDHLGKLGTLPEAPNLHDYQRRNTPVIEVDGVPILAGPKPPYFSFHGNEERNGSPHFSESPTNRFGNGVHVASEHDSAQKFTGQGKGQVLSLYLSSPQFKPFDARDSRLYTAEEARAMGLEINTPDITGSNLARELRVQFGHDGAQAFTDHLRAKGFNGVSYDMGHATPHPAWVLFDPRILKQVNSTEGWSPEEIARRESFDPTPMKAAGGDPQIEFLDPGETYYQRGGVRYDGSKTENRGYLQFGADRKMKIGFLEKANLSTFTHETGHMYMEILHDLAAKDDAPPQIKEDLATLRKFAGADPANNGPLTVGQHETLARAFEAHLMEGKAPSEALKGTFQRVMFWMLHVYKSLANLGVKLTDDVRGAFDRLYASDQEIEQARKEAGGRPLFASAEDMKATPAEFALYSKSAEGEIETAKTRLAQEKLRQEMRERTAAWNDEAAGIRERVVSEVDNDAVYQAFKALADGQLADGTPIKLDKDELVRQFGPEVVKELPRSFQRLYAREGGMDAEAAAEFLGFRSGEALVESLKAMEPRKARIERLTREEMLARHGDTLAPEAIAEAAQKEFHASEPESKLIELRALRRQQRDAAEALHLGKAEGKAEMAPKLQDAKAEVDAMKQGAKDQVRAENFWARGVVAEVPHMDTFKRAAMELVEAQQSKDLTPYRYLLAQRKAAQDAFEAMAKKDYGAAADAKQKELLNHFLYREATKGLEELEKGYDYMQKFGKASIRQKIGKAGADYLEQIDGFLERFQFVRETNKAIGERQRLAEFAQLQVAGGEEIYFDPSLYTEQPKNYREMTIPEFRAVRDAIKNIETVARRQYEFDSEGKRVAFHDAVAELDAAARANANRIKPLPVDPLAKGVKDKVGDWFLNKDAMLLKMEQMVEWLDGGDINGPWTRYIFDPIAKAQAKEYALQAEVTARLGEAMEAMPKAQRLSMLDTFDIPGIGKVTRKMILSMAMNMGNAENYEKMLKGHGWASPEGLEAVGKAIAKLNRADWEFVQATWDRLNELWPQIADLEQRMTGLEPAKVEAAPFTATLEDGSTMAMRGGYYPLMYDPARSSQGAKQESGDLAGLTEEGYARATTSKGHTKERTKFSAPLVLDFEQVLASHTAKVIKDLTHREAVLAINKLITNQTVRTTIQETLGPTYEAQFLPWLRGVVNDRNASVAQGLGDFNRTMMTLRANVAAATLGFKVSSVLVQATDLMRAADRVPQLELAGAFKDFIAHPVDTTMKVRELSEEMRFRADNIDRDMRAKLQDLQGKTGHYKEVMEFAFHGLGWADAITSTTAWLGAYRAELKNGTPEEQAVRQADRTVRLLMQAGNPKDLTAIQRQDGLAKIVTMFMGDASATYGLLRDTIHQTSNMGDTPKMAARILFGAILPAIVGDLIKQRGPGIADDDPDKAKKWAQWVAMKTALVAPSSIPVLRDLANAIDNGMDYRFTPVASGLQKAGKLFAQGGKLIEGKGNDGSAERFAFNLADTIGTIGGIPGTAQVTTSGKYLYRVRTGEERPKDALEFAKNVVFGKNPQEKK